MDWHYCPSCGQHGVLERPNHTLTQCSACGYRHFNNAKAAVAIVLVQDNQMLVSQRGRPTDPNFGKYEFPGGFVDFESAQAAAVREAREELGVTIDEQDLELLDVYWNDFYVPTFNVFTIDTAFMVRRWQGSIQAADDVAAVAWKPFDFIHTADFCQKHYDGLDRRVRERLDTVA